MDKFWKFLLAAVLVCACVGAAAFAGCLAGLFVGAAVPGAGSSDNRIAVGAFIGMGVGALLGLFAGGMLARKAINPPPPRE